MILFPSIKIATEKSIKKRHEAGEPSRLSMQYMEGDVCPRATLGNTSRACWLRNIYLDSARDRDSHQYDLGQSVLDHWNELVP